MKTVFRGTGENAEADDDHADDADNDVDAHDAAVKQEKQDGKQQTKTAVMRQLGLL